MIKYIVLFFFFLSFAQLSEAEIWENIPAFPQAQKVKQEEILVNNKPVQSTIYSTSVKSEEIIKFYKTKLINFGWNLKSEIKQRGMNSLVFYKEDNVVNLIVQNILERNYITIAQSKTKKESLKKEEAPCPECETRKEELIKKLGVSKESLDKGVTITEDMMKSLTPKETVLPAEDSLGKDLQFVPRYPGGVRVNDVERENGKKVSLAYYTKDPVEQAVDFYRKNMGNYYWTLEKEIDFQDLPEAVSEKIKMNIKGKSLVFKSKSASCIISITEDPQSKSTIIGVNYNEK